MVNRYLMLFAGLDRELTFSSSRSSGPGGQNVNKVNSKVELRFDLDRSSSLSEDQKELLKMRLVRQLTSNGELVLTEQRERSQWRNKRIVIERFHQLIENGLKPVRKRKVTRPTKASVRRRIELKKKLSEKKQRRRSSDSY